jgi:hypothetical protein
MSEEQASSAADPVKRFSEASPAARVVIVLALVSLSIFIGVKGGKLMKELAALKREEAKVRKTIVVAYHGIAVSPTLAARPANWIHDEGESTLLWSGWENGGHRWFRVGRGELTPKQVSYPMGRDAIRAIDYPTVEIDGGSIWSQIPADAPVVGVAFPSGTSAYPVEVLDRVSVVNDFVGDRPYLVVYDPKRESNVVVRVFDPVIDGHRVTMGLSGYYVDRKPLYYDRGAESLWLEQAEGGLACIAGRHKGARLAPARALAVVSSWSEWRAKNPHGRLLVGADRTKPMPTL